MDKNTLRSSTTDHQDSSDSFTNQNTNLELPPPYSPIQQHSISPSPINNQQDNSPNDLQASTSGTQPSAPSLYPEIPQRLPPGHNVVFPVPQPYDHHSQHHQKLYYNANVSTPLYQHANHSGCQQQQQQQHPHPHGQPGILYGSTYHSGHVPPTPPARFLHTVYLPGHQLLSSTQPHHVTPPIDSTQRHFPVGALVFIFGWAFPPLWILGFCCLVSRNPYEVWWARLNILMALLLLLSSIIYSMFAILSGDWYVGLQWIALHQEA